MPTLPSANISVSSCSPNAINPKIGFLCQKCFGTSVKFRSRLLFDYWKSACMIADDSVHMWIEPTVQVVLLKMSRNSFFGDRMRKWNIASFHILAMKRTKKIRLPNSAAGAIYIRNHDRFDARTTNCECPENTVKLGKAGSFTLSQKHEFKYYLSQGELQHVDCLSWAHSLRPKQLEKWTKKSVVGVIEILERLLRWHKYYRILPDDS